MFWQTKNTTHSVQTTGVQGTTAYRLFLVTALMIVFLVGGCASVGSKLLGKRNVTISQAELLAQMLKFKPEHMEWLNRLNVELSPPRLALDAENNRIQTEWDLELKKGLLSKLLKQKAFKKTIGVSTKLAFKPETNSIVLKGVKLNSDVGETIGKSFSPEYGGYINQFINLAIEKGLEDYPVYQFKKEQLRYAGIDWNVEDINVLQNGLSVGIAPRK